MIRGIENFISHIGAWETGRCRLHRGGSFVCVLGCLGLVSTSMRQEVYESYGRGVGMALADR